MKEYWVKYRWEIENGAWQEPVSCFVTTGDGTDFPDLEAWWVEESRSDCPHEILEIVKL